MEKQITQTVCPKEWNGERLDTIEKINEWYRVNIWSKIEDQE